jgi:hypothetical protein
MAQGLPHVADNVVEVLIQCMDWNMMRRQSKQTAEALADLGVLCTCWTCSSANCLIHAARRAAGTLRRLIVSCTRSVKLSCGATQKIPAPRALSMPTLTSSKQWLPVLTTRTFSFAFCTFMLAKDI